MDNLAEQFEALNIHEERQLDDLECEFQDIGSRLMHQREARPGTKENATRFKCHFGISARVAARTWQYLLRYQSPLPRGLRKCHLLWAAHFLKEYPKVRSLSIACGGVDITTACTWVWCILEEIETLVGVLIVWENRKRGDVGNDCLTSVDGVDCPYKQQKIWSEEKQKMIMNKALYSFKINGPALRYEIAASLMTSDIVWINGPFMPGIHNDLQLFRLGLKQQLEEGERVEADDIYVGDDPLFIKCPKGFGRGRSSDEEKAMRRRVQGRHESLNTNIKTFNCMSTKFRHSLDQHAACFRAIIVFTQIAIELGERSLFPIGGYK
jgi:hypothetical protein